MASHRAPTAGLSALGLALALTACAPFGGQAGSGDVGYETVIAAVLLAESDAGGRAFEVEIDDGTAQVHVAAGDRTVEVDVDLTGPNVTDRRDAGEVEAEDREALTRASTTLADGIRVAASAHAGDGSVAEVGLNSGAQASWTVEFTDGGEVAVAVTDGSIER
ncbi:MAG: hypothetical protein IJO71_02285 [Microbacterium sp.]|uniref:hypothetical protein n=1 Tax=Microbacterium sp. TaxID=51671 RepID=UPI0025DD6CAB|nr:hypothetical protein [Microbacterium sp.]MBQ9916010.1 hypothetical protein [Microbacterium sp.]